MKTLPPLHIIDRLDTRKIQKTTLDKGFAKKHLQLLRRLQEPLHTLKKDYK